MQYWWLSTNTKDWTFLDNEIGEDDFWCAYNESGNKRRIFENFEAAQAGDCFVGYISYPLQKVVCVGKITHAIDLTVPEDHQGFGFMVTSFLEVPVSLAELKQDPVCKNLKHFRQGYSLGSLFSISKKQYERIVSLGTCYSDINALDLTSELTPSKEGRQKRVYTTKYERNPKNRDLAIAIHGMQCQICGFDFEEMYGFLGAGFIEVHHVKPLHLQDEESIIDPATDLVCVCANCHRMLHRKRDGIVTVEELREYVKRNRNP